MRLAGLAALGVLAAGQPAHAQPVHAQAARIACASSSRAALPATVPITVSNNHVFVKACVAGRTLDFLLDTGAADTYIDLGLARALHLPLGDEASASGAGAATASAAELDSTVVTIAGAAATLRFARAIDFSSIPPREGHALDGILGNDFLSRYVVVVDYARQRLRIHDRTTYRYAGTGTIVPLRMIDGLPHVDATLKLTDGATIAGRMMVDMGDAKSVNVTMPWRDEHELRSRVGPLVRQRGGSGIGGASWFEMGRLQSLVIGGAELARPVVLLFGDSAGVFSRRQSWVASIGGDVLRRFVVTVDYARSRFILEPHAGTREPFEADMSGLALVMDASRARIVVDQVVPATPASDAGLRAGDTITAIDGVPVRLPMLDALRARLRTPNTRVTLTVMRGGASRGVVLVTRRML